ncbi:MAG: helix-turn-helix transcriptional regulator [Ilumatobacter sp.]|nr:helix-turn-helix transcriptional regulator [Ilumatobacter sp.]
MRDTSILTIIRLFSIVREMSDIRRRDYELDDEVDADHPQRLKAIADPFRMQICDLVLERAMTVTELAQRLDRPKGTVAYHVDVLVDAGLLKVVRTRRVRAVEERFYGRVARTIVFPHHDDRALPFVDDVLSELDVARHRRDDVPGFTTLRHARIPFARVDDYRRRLLELVVEFVDEPRDGDVEFGLYVALYPTTRSTSTATDTGREDHP